MHHDASQSGIDAIDRISQASKRDGEGFND